MLTRLTSLLLAAALLAAPAAARADEAGKQAVHVTQTLLVEAHSALAGRNDAAALQTAINRAFAFDIWERFLIGDNADAFSPSQRSEFRTLLPAFMAHLYSNQFERGLNQPPEIGEVRKVRRDYLVQSRFARPNGAALPVEWRLRDTPGSGPRVIDIMVGGTSFLLLKREEFTAIIDSRGPDGVLVYMRDNSLR